MDEEGRTDPESTAEPEPIGDDNRRDLDSLDRFDRIRRTAGGVMMTGIALGLQQAFELPKQEPPFVIKAPGNPDGEDGPIELRFDPDDPSNTVAVIRPRLNKNKATPESS